MSPAGNFPRPLDVLHATQYTYGEHGSGGARQAGSCAAQPRTPVLVEMCCQSGGAASSAAWPTHLAVVNDDAAIAVQLDDVCHPLLGGEAPAAPTGARAGRFLRLLLACGTGGAERAPRRALLVRLVLSGRRLQLCRALALMRRTLGVGGQEAGNCVIGGVEARRSVPVSVGFRATRCKRPIQSAAITEGVRGLRTCTRAQARQIRPSGLRSAAVRRQISPFLRGNDRAESTDSGRASHKSSAVTKEAGAW